MLNKQFNIYSVDTKGFYDRKERILNKHICKINYILNLIKEFLLINNANYDCNTKEGKHLDDYKSKYTTLKEFELAKKNKYVKENIKNIVKNHKKYLKSKEFKKLLNQNTFYYKWNYKVRKTKEHPGTKSKLEKLRSDLNKILLDKKDSKEVRRLNPKKISKYNLVAMFDSILSRILNLQQNQITEDLMIVRVFHYPVLYNLLNNGFDYNNEHYIFYTASAGQIRKKKIMMIKESILNKKVNEVCIKDTLTCGLSIEDINNSKENGCNINKFLAYLALNNSATDEWKDFNIDKAIVIDDFETTLNQQLVDYIPKINNVLEEPQNKVKKDVTITHSDGCGWILSTETKKAFQFRMPWFKGLLVPVNYIKWCSKYNSGNTKVKDIWGREWNLKNDDIKYVFSKSQFKMWKYYKNWDEYKIKFNRYNCQAGKCNMEENKFKKVNYCYQFWQTLDVEIEDIKPFTDKIDVLVTNAYTNLNTMLYLLGATHENKHKNYRQQALEIYPELLHDKYFKEQLSSSISSTKNNARIGKFIVDGYNTFFIPDVFAWMQFVFQSNKNPDGLLEEGEVSCKLFKDNSYLDINRAPSLYKEHAVRKNVAPKDNTDFKDYFISNGVYTSCKDMVSKILQFDNDGDHATIISDERIVELAKNSMEDVRPLYYEMDKAEPSQINAKNIYKALTMAFKSSNIGKYSNKLTKIWNKDDITGNDLNTAKIITAMNNFSIDSAKTLSMPTVTSEIKQELNKIDRLKVPYFFIYAKDYDKSKVADINNSTVNMLCKQIDNIKQGDYNFKLTGYRSAKLMHNKDVCLTNLDVQNLKRKEAIKKYGNNSNIVKNIENGINEIKLNNAVKFLPEVDEVIEEYKKLDKEKNKYFFKVDELDGDDRRETVVATWSNIRNEFNKFCMAKHISISTAADIIIKYIYSTNRDAKKTLLFNVFGDIIIDNLKANIKNPLGEYIICKKCGKRIKKESNRQIMCSECSTELRKQKDRDRKKK